jgi:hypothetical protein
VLPENKYKEVYYVVRPGRNKTYVREKVNGKIIVAKIRTTALGSDEFGDRTEAERELLINTKDNNPYFTFLGLKNFTQDYVTYAFGADEDYLKKYGNTVTFQRERGPDIVNSNYTQRQWAKEALKPRNLTMSFQPLKNTGMYIAYYQRDFLKWRYGPKDYQIAGEGGLLFPYGGLPYIADQFGPPDSLKKVYPQLPKQVSLIMAGRFK